MSLALDSGTGLQLLGDGIKIKKWNGSAWVDAFVVDGNGNILTMNSQPFPAITVSTASPSGGKNGDLWLMV